jgi:hypothetical protein
VGVREIRVYKEQAYAHQAKREAAKVKLLGGPSSNRNFLQAGVLSLFGVKRDQGTVVLTAHNWLRAL